MLGMLTHMICDGSTPATWLHLKVRVARVPSSEAFEVHSAGVTCMRCAILKVASSRYSAKPADKQKKDPDMHVLCYYVLQQVQCRTRRQRKDIGVHPPRKHDYSLKLVVADGLSNPGWPFAVCYPVVWKACM